ncbi:hypothetical protein DN062_15645 [Nitrincola tibetensis]|uniref:Ribosomal subunit interface protein n=1 Tax=Nitrincola tibetensis TaxID=2219697 RepID=A0A364NIW8_9GAMM|nr:HPF/RaiA family ribosome-associated protein [Nitrincola tibetensis]RAU16981.1 hypothetical protein DN062_15645 [Nitrincola tibetensis]
MIIQVNTDSSIEGNEALNAHVQATVEKVLGRFSEKVTRIEVHLHDENAHKSGDNDKRCNIEARVSGLQPIAVSDHADTTGKAVSGACDKMKSALESTLGRLANH